MGLKETKERREAQSVVVRQPHRIISETPDDPMLGSALGRFCWRRYQNRGTREDRFHAGLAFQRLVDDERVASGFPSLNKSSRAESSGALSDEELAERRKACRKRLYDIKNILRSEASMSAFSVLNSLCCSEIDIRDVHGGEGQIAYLGLYWAGMFFLQENPKKSKK